MNQPIPHTDQERGILETLEGALRAIDKSDIAPKRFEVTHADDPELLEQAMMPRCLSRIDEVIEQPAYWAIRLQAREVGWMLYAKGGTDLMREILESMPALFAGRLDHWWDRIGIPYDSRGFWVT